VDIFTGKSKLIVKDVAVTKQLGKSLKKIGKNII